MTTHVELETMVSSLPLAVAAFDAAGRVLTAAGGGYEVLGLRAHDAVGFSLVDDVDETDEADAGRSTLARAVRDSLVGESSTFELVLDGTWWHCHAVPAPEGSAAAGFLVGTRLPVAPAGVGPEPVPADWSTDAGAVPVPYPGSADPTVDLLTGLLSRQAVTELLAAPGPGEEAAVVLVDIDAFAMINESYGQAAGDTVLVTVAERLRAVAGTRWSVGRWSADVFALVLRAPGSPAELGPIAEAVAEALVLPVEEGTTRLEVTASTGTATTEHAALTDLLHCAAVAVRAAKQSGRDQVQHFHPRLHPAVAHEPRAAAALRTAMEDGQVGLHYQPVVRLSDRRAVGVEALARWSHPERGLLLAAQFVPLAERAGLIVPLGERLLREACHTAAEWQRRPPCDPTPTVAVNLSARQLSHPGLVAMVRDALRVSGCDPSGLQVEVTETAVMSDLDVAVATLTTLKDLGLGVALDDFGTGYSSLVYLKRFPVDVLKVDASFVAGLGIDPDDTAIVASLVSLAHSIGIACIAEGVETAEQLAILESMGCDSAQGYVFGRAMDPAGITTWLGRQPGRPRSRPAAAADSEVEPATADRILDLHRQGASLHTIAARLNVEGRRTARGSRWHHTTVAQVIAERSYPAIAPDA